MSGKYEQYEEESVDEEELNAINVEVKKDENVTNNTYLIKKRNNKINAKIKKLEREVEELEQKSSKVNMQMSDEAVYSDYQSLSELQSEIEKINNEIEDKMSQWEELQNMLNEGD